MGTRKKSSVVSSSSYLSICPNGRYLLAVIRVHRRVIRVIDRLGDPTNEQLLNCFVIV